MCEVHGEKVKGPRKTVIENFPIVFISLISLPLKKVYRILKFRRFPEFCILETALKLGYTGVVLS